MAQSGKTSGEGTVRIRGATVDDVGRILKLVNHYANRGLMLPKTPFKVYKNLQNYTVAEEDGQVVGCVSLVVLWRDLAEICSLAVEEGYTGRGLGTKLVDACLDKAKGLHMPQLIVLTYQDGFFEKLGFRWVDKDSFPRKLMWECLECPKLEQCDERAYIVDLR
jgi:amino-acid N-acetyltransferase